MARNPELLYEVDEKGQDVLVRSFNSEQCAYVRFLNSVSRPVDVWWRDFEGKRRHYARMSPRTCFLVDTYITHPWEFTDVATNESYVVKNNPIFRAPSNLGGVMLRKNFIITVRVRTLRQAALLALAEAITAREKEISVTIDISQFGLPRYLAEDLDGMVSLNRNLPSPDRNP